MGLPPTNLSYLEIVPILKQILKYDHKNKIFLTTSPHLYFYGSASHFNFYLFLEITVFLHQDISTLGL